jgi:hypothetical protein
LRNPDISEPTLLYCELSEDGPILFLPISVYTVKVIKEEEIDGIPQGWTEKDYMSLLDEGDRFFSTT